MEGAKKEVGRLAERQREELLELVLKAEGSVVPRAWKDLFGTHAGLPTCSIQDAMGSRLLLRWLVL